MTTQGVGDEFGKGTIEESPHAKITESENAGEDDAVQSLLGLRNSSSKDTIGDATSLQMPVREDSGEGTASTWKKRKKRSEIPRVRRIQEDALLNRKKKLRSDKQKDGAPRSDLNRVQSPPVLIQEEYARESDHYEEEDGTPRSDLNRVQSPPPVQIQEEYDRESDRYQEEYNTRDEDEVLHEEDDSGERGAIGGNHHHSDGYEEEEEDNPRDEDEEADSNVSKRKSAGNRKRKGTAQKKPKKKRQKKSLVPDPHPVDISTRRIVRSVSVKLGFFVSNSLAEIDDMLRSQKGFKEIFGEEDPEMEMVCETILREFYENLDIEGDSMLVARVIVGGIESSFTTFDICRLIGGGDSGFYGYQKGRPTNVCIDGVKERLAKHSGVTLAIMLQIIQKTLIPRERDCNGRVGDASVLDMMLLDALMAKDPVNLPALIVNHMRYVRKKNNHALPYPTLVKKILILIEKGQYEPYQRKLTENLAPSCFGVGNLKTLQQWGFLELRRFTSSSQLPGDPFV